MEIKSIFILRNEVTGNYFAIIGEGTTSALISGEFNTEKEAYMDLNKRINTYLSTNAIPDGWIGGRPNDR